MSTSSTPYQTTVLRKWLKSVVKWVEYIPEGFPEHNKRLTFRSPHVTMYYTVLHCTGIGLGEMKLFNNNRLDVCLTSVINNANTVTCTSRRNVTTSLESSI